MGAAAILTIIKDGEVVKTCPIESGKEAVLGRSEGCVIRLQDRAISRQHAVFRATEDGVQIERKSEFAPLEVNGAECTRAILKEGDVISIGPYLMKLSVQQQQQQSPQKSGRPEADPNATLISELPAAPLQPVQPSSAAGFSPAPAPAPASALEPEAEGDAPPADRGGMDLDLSVDEVSPLDMDFGGEVTADLGNPVEAGENATRTTILPSEKLAVRLVFKPGDANVTDYLVDKEEVTIGRRGCDIVLTDQKVSNRNCAIRRSGSRFSLHDLGSTNGTFLNSEKLPSKGERELSDGDRIRVGDVEFEFKAVDEEFAEQEANLALLPPVEDPADESPVTASEEVGGPPPLIQGVPVSAIPGVDAAGLGGIPGIGGVGAAPGAAQGGSLREKFRALPMPRKIMVGACILAALWLLTDFMEDEPVKAPKKAKAPTAQASAKPEKAEVTFDSLTPEQKKFVELNYGLAFSFFQNKDYDKTLYALEQIFKLIPDYKDSRLIERYAKQRKQQLEAEAEEKKKREDEARIKAKIAQLSDEIQEKIKARDYEGARNLLTEMIALDPENPMLATWKSQIEQHEQELVLNEQKRKIQREINARAAAIRTKADALRDSGRNLEAIRAYQSALALGPSDRKLIAAIKEGLAQAQAAIDALREPVLAEAREAEGAGEYAKAYQLYRKAIVIDPRHPEAPKAIARIRGALHERAKAIYTEAVMAESYSDLITAKKRFQEVLQTAPTDDVYYDRAKRKLAPYVRNAVPDEVQ